MRPVGLLLLPSQGAGSGGLRQAETSAASARKASTSLTSLRSSPDTSLEVSVEVAVAVYRVCHLRSHGSRLGFQVATSKPVGPVLVVPLPAEAPDPKATVAPTGSFTVGLVPSELVTSPGALEPEALVLPLDPWRSRLGRCAADQRCPIPSFTLTLEPLPECLDRCARTDSTGTPQHFRPEPSVPWEVRSNQTSERPSRDSSIRSPRPPSRASRRRRPGAAR